MKNPFHVQCLAGLLECLLSDTMFVCLLAYLFNSNNCCISTSIKALNLILISCMLCMTSQQWQWGKNDPFFQYKNIRSQWSRHSFLRHWFTQVVLFNLKAHLSIKYKEGNISRKCWWCCFLSLAEWVTNDHVHLGYGFLNSFVLIYDIVNRDKLV